MQSRTQPAADRGRSVPRAVAWLARPLPMAGVVEMEDMRGRKGNDPQADHQRADGQDPFASRTVMGSQPGGLADTKDLSANANDHQKGAESEGEPSHGVPLYPI